MYHHCLIAEDQTMFAEALSTSLLSWRLVDRCTVATDLEHAYSLVSRERFDLAVVDLLFPTGNANGLIAQAAACDPAPKIFVVTALSDPGQLQTVLTHRVDGVFVKTERFSALRERLEGSIPGRAKPSLSVDEEAELIDELLSKREREVLHTLGAGSTNQEIAARLRVSVRTIETHRKNISHKTGLRGGELVRAAVHYRDRDAARHRDFSTPR
jgi:DNA-binding NarL/FixJ family response regulator